MPSRGQEHAEQREHLWVRSLADKGRGRGPGAQEDEKDGKGWGEEMLFLRRENWGEAGLPTIPNLE